MSRRLFLAAFHHEQDVLAATREARQRGYQIDDVYAPYAVHGLDEAMGLRPSRLSWVCLVCALSGAGAALWFQFWASAVDWPLNVGGKPFQSLPAFVPITFELSVLFGGLGTVAALLLRCRLLPGRRAIMPSRGVTDHEFVLALAQTDATFDLAEVRRMCERHQAAWLAEQEAGRLIPLPRPEVLAGGKISDQTFAPHSLEGHDPAELSTHRAKRAHRRKHATTHS